MRERIFNGIGIGLLVLCFAIALFRVVSRTRREADPNVTTIRFAHWQLESGVRDAIEALADDYEAQWKARGRNVRIEQMPIPERVYPNWMVTQLVGGTAPEVIQIGIGINDERTARFFSPLTREVGEPNPYNDGTPLEGLPWRETFVDGLSSPLSYNQQLLDYFGIPMSMHTIRVFYNKELYQEIAGDAPPPQTFDELLDLCRQVREFGETHQRVVIPIVGSQYNAPYLMGDLFKSQTQRLMLAIDQNHLLRADDNARELGYLRGKWNLDTPAVRSAFELMHEIAGFMQPGYLNASREDATFYFVQRRALMVTTGSWDAASFHSQAPFEIGIFKLPLPSRDHPRFGPNILGPFSEASVGTGMTFGLNRFARDSDLALDFLRYLGSFQASQKFTDRSGWLPAVVGVEPAAKAQPFKPLTDGYPEGFSYTKLNSETARVSDKHMYLLPRPDGAEAFAAAIKQEYPRAVVQDIWAADRGRLRQILRNDTTLTGFDALMRLRPTDTILERKRNELREAQFGVELGFERSRWTLGELGHPYQRP